MKRSISWGIPGVLLLAGILAVTGALGAQEGGGSGFVSAHFGPNGAEWLLNGSFGRSTLTVSGPEGEIYRQELEAGKAPSFGLFDKRGQRLPDGSYTWELTAAPVISKDTREALRAARRNPDGPAGEPAIAALQKAGRLPRTPLVQSGSFVIAGGSIVEPEGNEARGTQAKKAPATGVQLKDQVIPDDLIVQGSTCVGFDCVNNEDFGFDTIRLKENSLRIHFDDTSTQAGFPANDWRLIANDSAAGGVSKFSIEDSTGAKTPFTVSAGATTNSIFVSSTGRVGFKTATPVLDLHVNTSNTPALRLEQNNSGGFTAQTWDIGANEANFFVRDVTGGSTLPFRIRPGAPSSTIDISADGEVGVGTASPSTKIDIQCSGAAAACGRIGNSSGTGFSGWEFENEGGTVVANFSVDNAGNTFRLNSTGNQPIVFLTESSERLRIPSPGGNVLTAFNGAFLSAGGTWTNGSSRSYKHDIVDLEGREALEAVKRLAPVKFQYNTEPGEQYVGFIAEDVPSLVAMNDHKSLSPMDVVAVLTKVVQEQQKTIEALSAKVEGLEKANPK